MGLHFKWFQQQCKKGKDLIFSHIQKRTLRWLHNRFDFNQIKIKTNLHIDWKNVRRYRIRWSRRAHIGLRIPIFYARHLDVTLIHLSRSLVRNLCYVYANPLTSYIFYAFY